MSLKNGFQSQVDFLSEIESRFLRITENVYTPYYVFVSPDITTGIDIVDGISVYDPRGWVKSIQDIGKIILLKVKQNDNYIQMGHYQTFIFKNKGVFENVTRDLIEVNSSQKVVNLVNKYHEKLQFLDEELTLRFKKDNIRENSVIKRNYYTIMGFDLRHIRPVFIFYTSYHMFSFMLNSLMEVESISSNLITMIDDLNNISEQDKEKFVVPLYWYKVDTTLTVQDVPLQIKSQIFLPQLPEEQVKTGEYEKYFFKVEQIKDMLIKKGFSLSQFYSEERMSYYYFNLFRQGEEYSDEILNKLEENIKLSIESQEKESEKEDSSQEGRNERKE